MNIYLGTNVFKIYLEPTLNLDLLFFRVRSQAKNCFITCQHPFNRHISFLCLYPDITTYPSLDVYMYIYICICIALYYTLYSRASQQHSISTLLCSTFASEFLLVSASFSFEFASPAYSISLTLLRLLCFCCCSHSVIYCTTFHSF